MAYSDVEGPVIGSVTSDALSRYYCPRWDCKADMRSSATVMAVSPFRRRSMHQIEHLFNGSSNGRKAMENPQGVSSDTRRPRSWRHLGNTGHALHIACPPKLRPSHAPNLESRKRRDHSINVTFDRRKAGGACDGQWKLQSGDSRTPRSRVLYLGILRCTCRCRLLSFRTTSSCRTFQICSATLRRRPL